MAHSLISTLKADPLYVVYVILRKYARLIPNDKLYLQLQYFCRIKEWSSFKKPKRFNEKLQWLKLYNRKPEYTTMVDKYSVKEYVQKAAPDCKIIKTLGVWEKFDDIDFNALPNSFVLKTTHDSGGGVVICSDKKNFDFDKARSIINSHLSHNWFWRGREWPYKNVPPRIIADEFMVDESGTDLKDYKWYCFNGKPRMLLLCSNRSKGDVRMDFYDEHFNHLPLERSYPNAEHPLPKPDGFEKMLSIAEQLSKDIPFVRVDLYNINGDIYFGELTFFPGGGLSKFKPDEWDFKMGSWLKLPNE